MQILRKQKHKGKFLNNLELKEYFLQNVYRINFNIREIV